MKLCKQQISLRGGGCGTTKIEPQSISLSKYVGLQKSELLGNLRKYSKIISDKSSTVFDKTQSDEVMLAIQWFISNKENFDKMCQNDKIVVQAFDMILYSLDQLLKQISVYLRASGFLCLQILQICNDLFRILFSFLLKNSDRFIDDSFKQQILEYLTEFENNLKIESQNIWITGAEFELIIMQICVENCRSNSQKGQEILINFMSGLISSFMSLSPTEDLIYSLIEGGKFILTALYKKIENSIKLYEIYYFFETLKWVIINQLKQQQFSVKSQLNQLIDGYNKYIANSKDWIIHFCWIKLITDLLTYRPIINKFDFFQNQDSLQQQLNWNRLIQSKLITLQSYNRNEAKINLFYDYSQSAILKEFDNQFQVLGLNKIRQFQKYLLEQKLLGNQNICELYCQFTFDSQSKTISFNTFLSNLNIEKCQNTLKVIHKTLTDFNNLHQDFQQNLSILYDQKSQTKNNIQLQQEHCASLAFQLEQTNKCLAFLTFETQSQLLILANICQLIEFQFDTTTTKNLDEQNKLIISQIQSILNGFGDQFQQHINEFQLQIIQQSEILSSYEIDFQTQYNNQFQINKQLNISIFTTTILRFIEYSSEIINNLKKVFELSNQLNNNLQSDYKSTLNSLLNNMINRLTSRDFLTNYLKNSLSIFFKIKQKQNQAQLLLIDSININYNIQYLLDGIISQIKIYEYQICKVEFGLRQIIILSKDEIRKANKQPQYKDILLKQEHLLDELFQENKFSQQINKEKLNILMKQINADFDQLNNAMPQNELKKDLMQFFMDILSLLLQIQLQTDNFEKCEQKLKQLYTDQIKSIDIQRYNNSQTEQNNFPQQQKNLMLLKDLKSYFQQKVFDFQELMQNLREINTLLLNAQKIDDQNVKINQVQKEVLETFESKHYNKFIKDLEEMHNLKQTLLLITKESLKDEIIYYVIDKIYNFDETVCLQSEIEFDFDPFIQESQEQIQKMSRQEMNNNQTRQMDYKVRECLAFNIIKMQQIIHEEPLYNFSQNIIQQLWIFEMDERVKGVLKNKEMIELQKRLFSKDIRSVSENLKLIIQHKFDKINQTEQELQLEIDLTKKDKLQKNLLILNQELEDYVEGVNEMSQKMDINFVFMKEIQKQLHLIKERVEKIQNQINLLSNDFARLIGKSYEELLEIRKQKVLILREVSELNEVYIQLNIMTVDPITGQEIKGLELQQEINDFLNNNDKQYDVMLITGKAGSGKSKVAERIEVELWQNHNNNENWIPLFISLPTIKQPQFNIIDQALEKENYQFDKIQIQEFKEAIKNKKLKVVIILDSYDEMRSEFIYSNLCHSNRFITEFGQDVISSNFKVIISTRKELLTIMGYQTWFYGSSLDKMKEIILMSLNEDQIKHYIKQYCIFSIKKQIITLYETQLSLFKQQFIAKEFLQIWNSVFQFLKSETHFENTQANQLLSHDEIKKLQRYLKSKYPFKSMNDNLSQQLYLNLYNIWSINKYQKVIYNSNLQILFNTPFILSVIVQVLPNLSKSNKETSIIKDLFLENFMKIKQKQIQSEQKLNQFRNGIIQQEYNYKDIKDLGMKVLINLENQKFFNLFSDSSTLELIDDKSLKIVNQVFNVEDDAEIVYESLKQKKFTSYQFYESFISYYYDQQIDKWKKLGRVYNFETVKLDLQDFSLSLALDMTKNQVTSIEYKKKGELKIKKAHNLSQFQEEWQDQYFNDSQGEKEYKALLRNSMLIVQSGSNYSFSHTSIQEFYVAKYINDFVKRVELNGDRIGQLRNMNQDQQYQLERIEYSLFNQSQFNIVYEHFQGCLNILKNEILQIQQLRQRLIQLVRLSGIVPKLERVSSNSIYLLSVLNLNLRDEDLSNINLSDTKLYGVNLYNSNMQNSKLNNVSIDSCNLNRVNLSNVEWKNIVCKERPIFKGHKDYIRSIVIQSEGKLLISGGDDNIIIVWNIETCQQQLILEGHTDIIRSISIADDNQILASGSNDKTIRLWQVKSGKQMEILEGHEDSVICVVFGQDKSIIISGSQDNQIRIWNIKSRQIISILEGHNKTVTQLLLYNNGKRLISSSEDKSIIIWDVINRNKCEQLQTESEILSISIHPDEQLLSYGNKDGRIIIFNIQEIKQMSILDGHNRQVNCLGFNRNGQILASGSDDQSIRLWDVKTFKQIGYLQGHSHFISSLVFSPDGLILYTASLDQIIRQWNVQATKQHQILDGHLNYVSSICFSPDSLILASGSRDCVIKLWNMEDTTLICDLQGHSDMIWCVQFSPINTILASSSDDQTIRIWNTFYYKCIHIINAQCDSISTLAFSNDASLLASGSGGFSYIIQIWKLKDYSLITQFDFHSHTINTILFMQNCKIITGSKDNSIIITNFQTQQKEQQINIHKDSVNSLKIIQNILISASSDHTIKFYDLELQQLILTLQTHSNTVTSIAISPDKQLFVSASDDMTIALWNLSTKQLLNQIYTLDQVKCVDFSPNGLIIAAGFFDGSVNLYQIADNYKLHCYHSFSKCPLIQATESILQNSYIYSQTHCLEPLFIQKGAIKK